MPPVETDTKKWSERPARIVALAVVSGLIVSLVGWLVSRHFDAPTPATATQSQPQLQPAQQAPTSTPATAPASQVAPAKKQNPPSQITQHATAHTSGDNRPAVGSIQQGPGSALSIGQQGGITAGTVNIGTLPPKPLILTDAQSSLVRSDMEKFTGSAIEVWVVNRTEGTTEFSGRLVSALKAAGWSVQYFSAANLIRSNGTQPPPGLSLDIGPGAENIANELSLSLMRHGVIDNKPIPAMRVSASNKLALYICEPK